MNVLFLSIAEFDSIFQREIYPDLLREFMNNGHEIYVVSSMERRNNCETAIFHENHCHILKVKVGNITKSGLIEKGIATLLIEFQFKNAIKQYFSEVRFDLVLYSTPPITLVNAIKFVKNRDNAFSYLMLKDIFPQNAIDIEMLTKTGWKGVVYRHFRNKEKKLYKISDFIGCMSEANVKYILEHNSEIPSNIVGICPNSIEVIDMSIDEKKKKVIRDKYGIPLDKKVFVYGGNLGRPQGIEFMINCLRSQKSNDQAFFLIVGDGTEYSKIESYVKDEQPKNVCLLRRLPKLDYDLMVAACDVGMIFLDHRFTIPNYPSRLLSYMQAKVPVFAVTDQNTDIGKDIENNGFGWWCISDYVTKFKEKIEIILNDDLVSKRENEFKVLSEKYSVKLTYNSMIKTLGWERK